MKDLYILTGSCNIVGVEFYDEGLFDSIEEATEYAFDWAYGEAESYGEIVDDDDYDWNDDGQICISDICGIAVPYSVEVHGLENPWGIPYTEIYEKLKAAK